MRSMPSPAERFIALIKSTSPPLVPAPAAIERLVSVCRVVSVPKTKVVLKAGDVADCLFFIDTGLLRYYYLDPKTGAERTGQFFGAGAVVTDAASFLTGSAATQTVETVTASVLFTVPKTALLRAYDEDHAIERFGRKLVEDGFIGSQRRAANLLNMSPDERYRHFVENRPEISRSVPQYLLASFLGITPESLSRIRARIAKPKAKN